MDTITRPDARSQGLKRYFTGKPCLKGHASERRTSSGNCLACLSDIVKRRTPSELKARSEQAVEWARRNPERARQRWKTWKRQNKEKAAEHRRRWNERNRDRYLAMAKAHAAKVRRDRPDLRRAYEAERRARVARALPGWADLKAIRRFYSACPKGMHVDHIIPIVSDEVCGLHVLSNLRYLDAAENVRKHNKLLPEYARAS